MVEPRRPDNLIVDPSDFLDLRRTLATCVPSQSCLDVVRCPSRLTSRGTVASCRELPQLVLASVCELKIRAGTTQSSVALRAFMGEPVREVVLHASKM